MIYSTNVCYFTKKLFKIMSNIVAVQEELLSSIDGCDFFKSYLKSLKPKTLVIFQLTKKWGRAAAKVGKAQEPSLPSIFFYLHLSISLKYT